MGITKQRSKLINKHDIRSEQKSKYVANALSDSGSGRLPSETGGTKHS